MKKISILILVLCMLFMTACGSAGPSDALKADLENAKASPEDIIGELGEDGFGEEATEALVNKVLEFEYKLGDEAVDGDSAIVEVTITTYPFGEIFSTVVSNFIAEAFANPDMSEDEMLAKMDQMLLDAMEESDKSYSQTISVELEKEGGAWVVQESDELSNALTGGLLDFASGVES